MNVATFKGFYLGTYGDLDPNEMNFQTDYSDWIIGSVYGSVEAPAYDNISTLTITDVDHDGISIENDQFRLPDLITYNGVSFGLDSVTDYAVTLTYANGTMAPAEMELLQDMAGRLFLIPYRQGAVENEVLDDMPIRSIRFDAVVGDTYSGMPATPEPDAFVTCFLAGTPIDTPDGPVDIADLRAGDRVLTVDAGPQTVIVATRTQTDGQGRAAPVRIAPGALGPGVPEREMVVSRQHGVLVSSALAARRCGAAQVLVPAKDLVGLPGVTLAPPVRPILLHHVMLAAHNLLTTCAMISESLWPGPMALSRMSFGDRLCALHCYPRRGATVLAAPARPVVRGAKARALVAAHMDRKMPLQSAIRPSMPPAHACDGGGSTYDRGESRDLRRQITRTWVPTGQSPNSSSIISL